MTLRARFILVFSLLLTGLAAALVVIGLFQDAQWSDLHRTKRVERQTLLRELVALRGETYRHFVEDYGQWDETRDFVTTASPEFARDNLVASLPNFRIDRLWILRPDATLVYAVASPALTPPPALPLSPPELRGLFRQPSFHFFLRDASGLYEYHGASIVASNDPGRATAPAGFLLVAHRWSPTVLAGLAPIVQGTLDLHSPLHPAPPKPGVASLPLPGPDGAPAAQLHLAYHTPETAVVQNTDTLELAAAALIGLAALLVLGACLQRWIFQPLDLIARSLATDRLPPILPLLADPGEFGRLAALVRQVHDQQALLRATQAERERLNRDLHDGAIQVIYATGLRLTSARALIRSNPDAAEVLLEHSRGHLNDIIRELRRSISGLEAQTSPHRNFSDLIAALVQSATTNLRVVPSLDEALAARLTPAQRAQLLQFAREALSNASRHAHAREVHLTFRAAGADALLEISDDGVGFDPALVPPGGRGLPNLAARARDLGGTFALRSAPGQGVTVSLLLPALAHA